jgi:predicted RNase H-like HicB family nuclease
MQIPVLYEKINEKGFEGHYYAYIPTLGLTTQGYGIDGAKDAALDLVKLWLEENKSNSELRKVNSEVIFSNLEV